MIKKNDYAELEVIDTTNLGAGIAKLEGLTVFVNGGVTGDKVRAKIIKVTKSYLVARIEEFIQRSSKRSDNVDCPVFSRCGGCAFRHVSYEYELEIKKNYVKSCMKKSGLDEVEVKDVLTTGKTCGYRNKIQYPVSSSGVGYYAAKSHEVIKSEKSCPLHDPVFDPVIEKITEFIKENGISVYDEESGKGCVRHIYLRCTSGDDKKVMVCLVINAKSLKNAEELVRSLREIESVSGIMLCHNMKSTNVILSEEFTLLWGSEYIVDDLLGLEFKISPLSFYQVNHDGAELLYKTALDMAEIKKGDTLVDLFCGTGTIGLYMKKNSEAQRLVGVEIIEDAVKNARENAKANGVENAQFVCGDANSSEIKGADIIVIDPPRKGASPELVKQISELSPRQVVYISCDPATLARDMAIFKTFGYTAESVTPVDMFPRTAHVESVVCLARKSGGNQ
ncbi:MAG: 23S rRNA (uracil(1939)-C(5))-methyltransferase RlmD [Clostridia bacterium]|nr:23S rRNA (uracil(1939)-C(5))-methyltransferase RlmD [Clostridia bacterium]